MGDPARTGKYRALLMSKRSSCTSLSYRLMEQRTSQGDVYIFGSVNDGLVEELAEVKVMLEEKEIQFQKTRAEVDKQKLKTQTR